MPTTITPLETAASVLAPTIRSMASEAILDRLATIKGCLADLRDVPLVQVHVLRSTCDLIEMFVRPYLFELERPMLVELGRAVERMVRVMGEG